MVIERLDPGIALLAEKLLEGGDELGHVQPPVPCHEPLWIVGHENFRGPNQPAGDDFSIHRVGDAQDRLALHQAEVDAVFDVAGGDLVDIVFVGDDGVDHAADPVFLELVGKLIEVGFAALDDAFGGLADDPAGDDAGAVPVFAHLPSHLISDRVGEPGLAFGQAPGFLQRLGFEFLAGFLGVKEVEPLHLVSLKVAQGKGAGLDIEGAAAGDDLLLATGVDSVVQQIANPAEYDGAREAVSTVGITGAQLAEERNQGITDQSVHLIQKKDDRLVARLAPSFQSFFDDGFGRQRVPEFLAAIVKEGVSARVVDIDRHR